MTESASQAQSAPSTASTNGGWQSPGYRSARTRARWATVLVGITSAIAAFAALFVAGGFSLLDQAELGLLSATEGEQFDRTATALGVWLWAAYLASAIAVLAWLSRSVENVPPLGGGTPRLSPRWAIGWWFVPIANLWKPYGIVRDLWTRLATPARRRGSGVLTAWWVLWVVSAITDRVTRQVSRNAETIDELRGALSVSFVATVGVFVAGVLFILVIREIQARADERALALAVPAGPSPSGDEPA